ncbi:uncharacterized protein SOCE26_090030 [Sorangium cellulosum]|uniref:Uncharacterized protein n=1 Tax=Sorangium cellulosum TaxID=56 RepID=A0A2L0F7H8_SORCE|nr:hypothetical protein [Sorangium cellulosum]AUX47482.1 uncharacterized protein SOCE26_090030 [Sorangium cellulosum]
MELPFDLWHLAFVNLIQRRAPPNFEVQSEVRLSVEPQRADILLLRRIGVERQDHEARVLRMLWPRLGAVTVLEYKSPVDSAFRPGDLLRLVGYGVLYNTAHLDELPERDDLTLVLVVASVTPTLRQEIERMGWKLTPLGGGYGRIEGVMYTAYVVVTDDVTEAERDEYLRLFSRRPAESGEATRWLQQWMRDTKMKQPNMEELPGYEEMFQKLVEAMPVEKRLAGLAPEQRLAGLAPEQRLAGLAPEQVILALPLEMLRVLPEEYLRSLPADVQEQVRRRLQEEAH